MKKLKMILCLFAFASVLSACNKKPDAAPETVPAPVDRTEASASSYRIDFTNSPIYQHSFKMNIDQAEGKVDYLLTLDEDTVVQVELVKAQVTGCVATQVKHEVFWIPDQRRSQQGQFVTNGSVFQAFAGIEGKLMHTFRGLSGCKSIEVITNLKKY